MKKLLSIVLAVAMVIGCVAVTGIFTSAETATTGSTLIVNGNAEDATEGVLAGGWSVQGTGSTVVQAQDTGDATVGKAASNVAKFTPATDVYASVWYDFAPAIVNSGSYKGAGAGTYEISFWARLDTTDEVSGKMNAQIYGYLNQNNKNQWQRSSVGNTDIRISNKWQKFTFTATFSETVLTYVNNYAADNQLGSAALNLRLDASNANTQLYGLANRDNTTWYSYLVDDVTITPVVDNPTTITNGDAETATGGVLAADWATFSSGTLTQVADAGGNGKAASNVAKFVPGGTYGSASFVLDKAIVNNLNTFTYRGNGAGQYKVSFWVKLDTTDANTTGATAGKTKTVLHWQNGSNTAQLAASDPGLSYCDLTITDQWQKVTRTFDISEDMHTKLVAAVAADKTAVRLRLDASNGGNGGMYGKNNMYAYLIDDVTIEYVVKETLTVQGATGDVIKINGVEATTADVVVGEKAQIEVTLANTELVFKGLSDGTTTYPVVNGVVEFTMPNQDVTLTVVTETITPEQPPVEEPPVELEPTTIVNGDAEEATGGVLAGDWIGFSSGTLTQVEDAGGNGKAASKVAKFVPGGQWGSASMLLSKAIVNIDGNATYQGAGANKYVVSFWIKLDTTDANTVGATEGIAKTVLNWDNDGTSSQLGACDEEIGYYDLTITDQWQKVTRTFDISDEMYALLVASVESGNQKAIQLRLDASNKGYGGMYANNKMYAYLMDDVTIEVYKAPVVEEPNQGGEGTSKPEGTGDVLPVALIATVALASVALVVVSKKRKED